MSNIDPQLSTEVAEEMFINRKYNEDGSRLKTNAIEQVSHPSHYGGKDNPFEAIKVIEAWGLDKDFCLGNCVKYISRAGKKDPLKLIEDLRKAAWYLNRKIENLSKDILTK